ncbi:hypothetical protein EBT31_05555, partial [bacterium]|nr:hypothetical protein [bacterium]
AEAAKDLQKAAQELQKPAAKQADAVIQRWWGRPSLSEDMTPEREDKARQLNDLDPQVNPQAAFIDPNERRMLALNIIFGSGNVQLVQAGEGFAGPIPLPGNTVPDLEPIDRVTVTGQAGPRSQMWAFGNIYQRIVAEMPNAPTKNLGLSWLKEAAGVTRERDPERKAALEKLIESSAANIWKQLEIDGMVTRRGIGYRAVPEGLRLQELGAQELQRVLNLDSLNKALDAAAKTQNNLGLTWLTRAVGKPILPHEARSIWNRLEASGAVVPAGAYYKAVPRDKRVPGKSKVAAPPTPPSAAPTGTPQPGTTDVLGAVPNNLAPAKFDGGGNIVQKANVNALPNGEMKRRINRVLPTLNTVQEKLLYLRNFLMDQMRQVAKETLTVLDLDTGKLAGVESSNDYGMVQASSAIRQTMGDFSKRFAFQHSHPSNTGLSGADIRATLSTPGVVGAMAHGSRGLDSLMLVPTQIRGFFAGLTPQRDYVLYRVAELAEYGLREYYTSDFILNNLPSGTTLKKGELFALRISLRNLALAQTGLFQYADTSQARLRQLFPNLNDLIDGFRVDSTAQMVMRSIAGKLPKAAEKVRSSNAQDAILNFDRLSQRILQPGGLEAALGSGSQPAAKPGKGGLPGVPTGYPAETEAGRGDSATEGDYPDGRLTFEAETPRDLTSMGRRGFLRGVGAAASQAGMPGTSLVKGAVEAGAGIKDMVAKADAILKALDTISETKYSFFDFPRLFSKWTVDSERTDMLEKLGGSGPVGELASRLHQTLGEIWGPYNSTKVSSDLDYMVAGHAYTDSDAEYSRRLLERAAPREYSVARTLVANERRIKRELESLGEKFQRIQDEARKSFDSVWKNVGWAKALGVEQDREGHFRLTRALHIGDTNGAIGRLIAASNPVNTVVDPIDLRIQLDPDMNFAKAYPVAKELVRSGALDSYENFSRFWAARMPPDTLARYLEPFKLRGRGDATSTSMKLAFNELGSLRDDLAFLDNLPAENVQNLVNYAANLSPQMTAHLNDVSRKLLSEFQQEAKKAAPIIERAQQQLKSIADAYRDIKPALRQKSRMSTDEVERAEEKKRLMDEMRQDVVTRLAGDYTWREMVQPLPGTMRQGSLVLPSSMGELAPAMNTLTKELERQDKMADALNEAYSCRI